jgi:hypothetical protein
MNQVNQEGTCEGCQQLVLTSFKRKPPIARCRRLGVELHLFLCVVIRIFWFYRDHRADQAQRTGGTQSECRHIARTMRLPARLERNAAQLLPPRAVSSLRAFVI